MTKFALILFLVGTIMACTKKSIIGDREYVTLSYEQTQCADPWATSSNDSLTLKNCANYLNASGFYIAGLSIKQQTAQAVCNACNCKTGKIIYVSTFNSDSLKARYMRIGFK